MLGYVVLGIGVVEVDVAAVVDDACVGTPRVLFDVPDAHLNVLFLFIDGAVAGSLKLFLEALLVKSIL